MVTMADNEIKNPKTMPRQAARKLVDHARGLLSQAVGMYNQLEPDVWKDLTCFTCFGSTSRHHDDEVPEVPLVVSYDMGCKEDEVSDICSNRHCSLKNPQPPSNNPADDSITLSSAEAEDSFLFILPEESEAAPDNSTISSKEFFIPILRLQSLDRSRKDLLDPNEDSSSSSITDNPPNFSQLLPQKYRVPKEDKGRMRKSTTKNKKKKQSRNADGDTCLPSIVNDNQYQQQPRRSSSKLPPRHNQKHHHHHRREHRRILKDSNRIANRNRLMIRETDEVRRDF